MQIPRSANLNSTGRGQIRWQADPAVMNALAGMGLKLLRQAAGVALKAAGLAGG
jgi:hypothetical protein